MERAGDIFSSKIQINENFPPDYTIASKLNRCG